MADVIEVDLTGVVIKTATQQVEDAVAAATKKKDLKGAQVNVKVAADFNVSEYYGAIREGIVAGGGVPGTVGP